MPYDFTADDLKDYFNIDSAAIAWGEIVDMEDCKKLPFLQMRSTLLQAIQNGTLDAEVTYKPVTQKIGGSYYDKPEPDYYRATICRNDLKEWALARGQKPKFLFPEMRIVTEDAKEPASEEKEPKFRESQLDKARCHAIAQMLWDENPTSTIADMIRDKRILKYGNGSQYTEKTLHEWLKEIDPRAPDARIGRPKKVVETAE